MKATHTLVIAITLGLAAAAFNFFYLYKKSPPKDDELFLGIKQGVTIDAGDVISEQDDLVEVRIPRNWVGNLDQYAIPVGRLADSSRPWRRLEGPALLLYDDVKPPLEMLELGENEAAIGVPVDARSYPVALVAPGDQVSFVVPQWRVRAPTPAPPPISEVPDESNGLEPEVDQEASPAPATFGSTMTIGPFEVLSLGNRLSSAKVMKANRVPQSQGNVITIKVTVGKDYKLANEGTGLKAQELLRVLHATGFRQVSIIHFPQNR